MIRQMQTSVFLNHHDTWTYLVEAMNDEGVSVTIRGHRASKRSADAAAVRAQIALRQCLKVLDA
jgi:hypothetical protein